ncbi:hypothetical protein T265_04733 [Opisthorchis viverrini]|uniref:Uncharacterized protein n=1 Tax=Opisthorchis viverrini TaxID=6198 RepID=A0A074ZRG2_OPIVI|nr:hypothetical protein T265_04733 [Opisthorchis viverrini]KER28422.1 hypothetical protein T265_04733 [Opisthorchis viverrini]
MDDGAVNPLASQDPTQTSASHGTESNLETVRLLKIHRQPTTGLALLGAQQVGAVPEFPSTLFYLKPTCTKLANIHSFANNFFRPRKSETGRGLKDFQQPYE